MEKGEIYKHPIVQMLLNELPLPGSTATTSWELSFPIVKKFDERHIIAGYASVEVIDSQEELIPIPVLKEAWKQFKKNKDFYFGTLMHSNVPVIKILDEYKAKDGELWKSGVDENGLFIVAEVRQDIQKGKQTWELIEKEKLTGFSIGGEALESSRVCEGKCFTRIEKMELHEIAVVDKPANQPSVFKILKRQMDKDMNIDEIKWKIKELIDKREELNKKINPLPWETRLGEKEKSDILSELEFIDKQLSKYKNSLGVKLAEQSLLSKAMDYDFGIDEIKMKIDELIKRRIELNGKISPLPWEKKLTDIEKESITSEVEDIDKELGEYRLILGAKLADQTLLSKKVKDVDMIGEILAKSTTLEKLDIALARLIGKPFAGYKNFKDCVAQNQQAKDPDAYCASIMRQVEGKNKQGCNYIECPVDDAIGKSTWDNLDKGIIKLTKNELKKQYK